MEYFTEMIKSATVSNSIPMVPTPRKLKLKSVIMKYVTEKAREKRDGMEARWSGEERGGRGERRTRRQEERRLIQT